MAERRERWRHRAWPVAFALALVLAGGLMIGIGLDEAAGTDRPAPAVTRTRVVPGATVTVTAAPQGTLPGEPSSVPVVNGKG